MIPDMVTHHPVPPLDLSAGLSLSLDEDFLSQGAASHLDLSFDQANSDTLGADLLIPPTTTTTTTTSRRSTNSPSYAPNSSGFSTFTLNINGQSPDSSSSSSAGTKRKADSPEDEAAAKDLKRQRNTMAARKYRQKRLDRIAELEQALADMTGERDDLRLKLARREAQVDALREMLVKK